MCSLLGALKQLDIGEYLLIQDDEEIKFVREKDVMPKKSQKLCKELGNSGSTLHIAEDVKFDDESEDELTLSIAEDYDDAQRYVDENWNN